MCDLRYIACLVLCDDYGIDEYAWEEIEKELVTDGITDVSKCVKTKGGRWFITDEDFVRLTIPHG